MCRVNNHLSPISTLFLSRLNFNALHTFDLFFLLFKKLSSHEPSEVSLDNLSRLRFFLLFFIFFGCWLANLDWYVGFLSAWLLVYSNGFELCCVGAAVRKRHYIDRLFFDFASLSNNFIPQLFRELWLLISTEWCDIMDILTWVFRVTPGVMVLRLIHLRSLLSLSQGRLLDSSGHWHRWHLLRWRILIRQLRCLSIDLSCYICFLSLKWWFDMHKVFNQHLWLLTFQVDSLSDQKLSITIDWLNNLHYWAWCVSLSCLDSLIGLETMVAFEGFLALLGCVAVLLCEFLDHFGLAGLPRSILSSLLALSSAMRCTHVTLANALRRTRHIPLSLHSRLKIITTCRVQITTARLITYDLWRRQKVKTLYLLVSLLKLLFLHLLCFLTL